MTCKIILEHLDTIITTYVSIWSGNGNHISLTCSAWLRNLMVRKLGCKSWRWSRPRHVTPRLQHFTVSQNHSSHHPSHQGNLSSLEFVNGITLYHLTTRPNWKPLFPQITYRCLTLSLQHLTCQVSHKYKDILHMQNPQIPKKRD